MSELKRCPFCGGEIKLDEDDFYMFCCDDCGVGITFAKKFPDGTAEECTKAESIEKWNTRIPMQNIVERLEEESNKILNEFSKPCMSSYERGFVDSKMYGLDKAIEIVKEEGDISDQSL